MNQPLIFDKIRQNLEQIIRGKSEILQQLLVAYFAGGHVLLEDIPGVGKTTLAKALAISVAATFHRVQFTPDLLPGDITGTMIYDQRSGEFTFRSGPIFTDILLADEINRASPRTQSALLEAMNEWQVSVEGKALKLAKLFTVIATQNPVAFHGTYPLPEAQLDRFSICLALGYPQREDETAMLAQQQYDHPLENLQAVVTAPDIETARHEVKSVKVGARMISYLLDIVSLTRHDPRLKLGISPRGTLALYRISQAWAWSQGRDFVLPDDIKKMAVPVLAHRLMLEAKVRHSGLSKEEIVKELLEEIKVPV